MPKYYVRSDELEKIIVINGENNQHNALEAAKRAVLLSRGETVDHCFYVDERGFRGPKPSDMVSYVMSNLAPSYAFNLDDVIHDY